MITDLRATEAVDEYIASLPEPLRRFILDLAIENAELRAELKLFESTASS